MASFFLMSRLIDMKRYQVVGLVSLCVLLIGLAFSRSRAARKLELPEIENLIKAERYDEADSALASLLRETPEDSGVLLGLGALRGVQGRDHEAVAAFMKVSAPPAAKAQAQSLAGELLLKERLASKAEEAFRTSIESNPMAIDPKRRLFYLLDLERRDEEGRILLWDIYKTTRDARHLITLVGTRLTRADSKDTKPELHEFLVQTPDDPLIKRGLGLTLLGEGKPLEALPYLEAAMRSIEDDPTGKSALAESHLLAGQPNKAEESLGPEPEGAERTRWYFLKGRIQAERGDLSKALDIWKQGNLFESNDREALYVIGQYLIRDKQQDQAKPLLDRSEVIRIVGVNLIRELDRALREGPDVANFLRIAELCDQSGLSSEAQAWYREVVNIDASQGKAQAALARATPEIVKPKTPIVRRDLVKDRRLIPEQQTSVTKSFTFIDRSRESGLIYSYDCGATSNYYLPDTMGGGVALIDYDNDGRLDVYFINGCPLPLNPANPQHPNKLFHNNRDGTFTDVTDKAGVAGQGYGMGCAVGDYDNDGFDDLYVTGLGRTILYRNRGNGTFEDVTDRAKVASDRWTTGAGFADMDGDGDLDLIVITYVEADPKNVPDCRDPLGKPMHCPPGQFPAQFDQLFRNNGDGTFTDVSREAGIEVQAGLGLGLAIADFDGDGRLDFFVANDAAPNFLFRNQGGLVFEEVGILSSVAFDGTGRATAGMGVVAEDLDGDHLIDIFHTNFLNEPNTFHKNLGQGLFTDDTLRAGLDAPSRPVTGFGTAALDADNDGLIDLFVANGHVDDRPWVNHPMPQLPHFYSSESVGKFVLTNTDRSPYLRKPVVGRGVAAGDLDNDGKVDLIVVHRDAPSVYLRNETKCGNWITIKLKSKANRLPVGTRVKVKTAKSTQTKWLTTGTSYLSANDQRLNFGLGESTKIDRLEVQWPSGFIQTWENVASNRFISVEEGETTLRD